MRSVHVTVIRSVDDDGVASVSLFNGVNDAADFAIDVAVAAIMTDSPGSVLFPGLIPILTGVDLLQLRLAFDRGVVV